MHDSDHGRMPQMTTATATRAIEACACAPSAAIRMAVAQAIGNAIELRQRVAALRVRICPVGGTRATSTRWPEVVTMLQRRFVPCLDDWRALPDGAMGFAAVLGNVDDRLSALSRAKSLVSVLDTPTTLGSCNFPFTVAVGIGLFPEDGIDADGVLASAARALREICRCGQSAAGFPLRGRRNDPDPYRQVCHGRAGSTPVLVANA